MTRFLPMLNQHAPPVIHLPSSFPPVAVTPTVTELLKAGAPVCIGMSGGKDSGALAYALQEYLDEIGHTGPRLGIHCDLGIIEWRDSQRICQEVADKLGLTLVTIHTDMIGRWKRRWQSSVHRYKYLLCVKLIKPWSSLKLRFCTGEMKVAPICSELVRRFPGAVMLSAAGLRHDESEQRKNAAICKEQPKLTRKKVCTAGFSWNPLVHWTEKEVYGYHAAKDIPLHPAYTVFGCSRVSCVYCIASTRANMLRATLCEDNHVAYRELVPLEAVSTFSFQENLWLGDLSPQLLDEQTHQDFLLAKDKALQREAWEKKIPEHLLYSKGWPTLIPTWEEACLLGEVRQAVGQIVGIETLYTQPGEIRDRFAELIEVKTQKDEAKRKKEENKRKRAAIEDDEALVLQDDDDLVAPVW